MKKFLISLMISLTVFCGIGGGVVSAADPINGAKTAVCEGISGQTGGTCATQVSPLNKIIEVVLNVLSVVAGVTAVIMIVISGLKYITSSGDSNNVSSAKNTLVYAIVGLIVVAFAQFIVHFVLGNIK